jgi:hypothetical protein
MAAEALAAAGHPVTLAEAQPTLGRKFLMAGKSGLNVTKDEAPAAFAAAYTPPGSLAAALAAFGPAEVMAWCRALGQEVFTGSSGRVFPVAMKASPLLRAWAGRLAAAGVGLRTRWRWTGWDDSGAARFATPEGERRVTPSVTVLALGGASWPRLGSDAAWVPWLEGAGVRVTPFRPANMGFAVAWTPHMARHFGVAVKGVALRAGDGPATRGEFVLTAKGVEGGGIYALSSALREGAPLRLDLAPDLSAAELALRVARLRPGETLANRLRKLGLAPAAAALVQEFGRTLPLDRAIKALPVPLAGPLPLAEAISSAGGIAWEGVTEALELRARPGTFVAGEMLDWEAPTGGYLLTASWATGLMAGRAAAAALAGRGG